MDRYVNKDEALKAVSFDTEAYTAINMLHTVEVVRCKDCKCWNRDDEYCVDFLTQDKNGFCSWWEKRKGEKE